VRGQLSSIGLRLGTSDAIEHGSTLHAAAPRRFPKVFDDRSLGRSAKISGKDFWKGIARKNVSHQHFRAWRYLQPLLLLSWFLPLEWFRGTP
jgi:hypothetical protein